MHRSDRKSVFPTPNSVAPPALQNEFKTHEQTKYPFTPAGKRPKCVKVILNSTDRQAGSTLTSAIFNIRLPTEFQNKKLNLVVDSFVIGTAPNSVSNLSLYPYYIRLNELRSPYSYSSATGTTSGMILLTTGTSYQNNSPRENGGVTVTDTTLFDRPVTVEFWSPHFKLSAANGITNNWSVQISLWDSVDD
jgi:hypothetical protein